MNHVIGKLQGREAQALPAYSKEGTEGAALLISVMESIADLRQRVAADRSEADSYSAFLDVAPNRFSDNLRSMISMLDTLRMFQYMTQPEATRAERQFIHSRQRQLMRSRLLNQGSLLRELESVQQVTQKMCEDTTGTIQRLPESSRQEYIESRNVYVRLNNAFVRLHESTDFEQFLKESCDHARAHPLIVRPLVARMRGQSAQDLSAYSEAGLHAADTDLTAFFVRTRPHYERVEQNIPRPYAVLVENIRHAYRLLDAIRIDTQPTATDKERQMADVTVERVQGLNALSVDGYQKIFRAAVNDAKRLGLASESCRTSCKTIVNELHGLTSRHGFDALIRDHVNARTRWAQEKAASKAVAV